MKIVSTFLGGLKSLSFGLVFFIFLIDSFFGWWPLA